VHDHARLEHHRPGVAPKGRLLRDRDERSDLDEAAEPIVIPDVGRTSR
jgi:hypothetical protein